ncbi:hypothetical protein HED51_24365 [Ochrobactrum grignonense]|nr:hypothetical protein [Brucella grignonensis]NKB84836.1 hypothetical protein [Brucella grignonensis]
MNGDALVLKRLQDRFVSGGSVAGLRASIIIATSKRHCEGGCEQSHFHFSHQSEYLEP